MRGRLLQELQRRVLGGGVHALGLVNNIDLALRLVRQNDGVGGEGANLVDGDVLLLLPLVIRRAGEGNHVRVDAGLYLAAVAAYPAGLLPLAGADGRHGKLPRFFQAAFPRGRADQAGVGDPAAREGLRLRHIHPAFPIQNHYILP